jgi:CspA family cold shock protein
MEYSRGTAFLNLLPDSRLRQAPSRISLHQSPGGPGWALRNVISAYIHQSPALTKEHDMASMSGTIKRLVSDKGFGFILAGDGNEYFFHTSACQDTRFDDLREGQAVTFDMGQGPKGPRGENVRLS